MPETVASVFLFDVDGVIVDPLGYRAGISRTVEALCRKECIENWHGLLPDESDIAFMEARGIHDVWDITNIVFGIIVAHNATGTGMEKLSYKAFVDGLDLTDHSKHPPDLALEELTKALLSANISKNRMDDCIDQLRRFLLGTRSAYQSTGTRLFQNIILGPVEFERTYALKSEYDGDSLLTTEDRVLISASSVNKLTSLSKNGRAQVAVYTARPSLPPCGVDFKANGYSPEAELALQMAGMSDFPLVGMGMMDWLADRKSVRSEHLTKPNTTQAFAALLAATVGSTTADILEYAFALDKSELEPEASPLAKLKNVRATVYVFEDTVSGIHPLLLVAKRLNQSGYSIDVKALGIARDGNKRNALSQVCSRLFFDVNEAIELACSGEPL